jgi:hypothetical protein
VAGEHRVQLQQYGLPLPPTGRGPGMPRVARIPGLLARVAGRLAGAPRPAPPPPRLPLPPAPRAAAPRFPFFRLPFVRPREPELVGGRETFEPRSILSVIVLSSRNRQPVRITYRKKTARDLVVTRDVEFYSIRYRDTKHGGRTRYLYGWCEPHNEIHSFIIDRILSVQPLPRRFTPRFVVEL